MTMPDFDKWGDTLFNNYNRRSDYAQALKEAFDQGYAMGYREAVEVWDNQVPDIDSDPEEIARIMDWMDRDEEDTRLDDILWIEDDERIWNKKETK